MPKIKLSRNFIRSTCKLALNEDLYPLAVTALRRLEKLTSINKKISSETINTIKQLKDPSQIGDNIASHLSASISEKQQIFETLDVKKRLNSIIKIMENETSIIGVEKRIRGRVKTQMEKTQREDYLNEQLKAIQKELGVKISKFLALEHFIKASYIKLPDKIKKHDECKALTRAITEQFEGYIKVNKKISYKEVLKSLKNRDYLDKNRKYSPLKKTKDSILINTSKLSKKACFYKIKALIDKKLKVNGSI